MAKAQVKDLLEAGVHFGHMTRKWNPNMAPYIFMEKNGIHILDLQKTAVKMDESAAALKQIAKSGRKILFVATKKQAKQIICDHVGGVNMLTKHYISMLMLTEHFFHRRQPSQ